MLSEVRDAYAPYAAGCRPCPAPPARPGAVPPTTACCEAYRAVLALPAGATVVTHGLGRVPSSVDIRNSFGAEVLVRLSNFTNTTVTVTIPTPQAVARFTIT